MKVLLEMFIAFAKVGVMTFGGGYAMIPILQREICDNKGWATEEELMDYYAIGQCTPGVIAVNTATFIGNKYKGIIGGIVCTLGVVFPSVVIITIIAALIRNFMDLEWVQHAFGGIRVCVCVFILNSVIKLGKSAIKDIPTILLFSLVLLGSVFLNFSPVLYVVLAACIGILCSKLGVRKK